MKKQCLKLKKNENPCQKCTNRKPVNILFLAGQQITLIQRQISMGYCEMFSYQYIISHGLRSKCANYYIHSNSKLMSRITLNIKYKVLIHSEQINAKQMRFIRYFKFIKFDLSVLTIINNITKHRNLINLTYLNLTCKLIWHESRTN